MLRPVRRRTWAPSGQTPIQKAWDRHDRLSAIGALALSPRRQRISFYFQLLPENVRGEHLLWFLTEMHRYLRRTIILVWDRSGPHRSAAAYFRKHHPDWFSFEWLPAYAPELNPTEQCWNHTKHADLANFIPDDVNHLHSAVTHSFKDKQTNRQLLTSCFAYTQLDLE
jgi:transposase